MININKILLEEKNRILELHKTATKNHYLMEDTPINTSFKLDKDVTLENKNGGDELKLFKNATFYISRKGFLYANTVWQLVTDFTGTPTGKDSNGKDNVYYNCSSGKFSVGKEQKLPPCPTNDGKCKNLYYIDDEISFRNKISHLCQLSQTFVKGKTIEKKIENNKNIEQVKTREVKTPEVKTPEVKTPEVKSVVQPVVQTPENVKIVSDVDNYDEAALAKIAAEIQ
jgi:hypothetical protein